MAEAVLGWLLPVRGLASREARVVEWELVVPLATTYEAAGGEAAWSPEEVAVFEQLEQEYRERCRLRT